MPHSGNGVTPGPPLGERTTRDLLREARGGNEEALNILFERAREPLKRWARGRFPRWARRGIDTEDLVNDALASTFRRIDSFEPRHDGAFHAYLCQAVANRMHDEIDKARRAGALAELSDQQPGRGPSPEEEAAANEAFARYEEALELLDPEAREAVRMRIDLQCSYEEIARSLGKPTANAARMTVSRAIARMAREMPRAGRR